MYIFETIYIYIYTEGERERESERERERARETERERERQTFLRLLIEGNIDFPLIPHSYWFILDSFLTGDVSSGT